MSRVGKQPITIPAGVNITVDKGNVVTVKGPKGELHRQVDPEITISIEDGTLQVSRPTDLGRHRAMHGLYRALIANMVKGVTEGFEVKQELVGVGYRATVTGQLLDLSVGYSHEIVMELPKEISIEAIQEKGKNPIITMRSIDNELLGMVAAKIRSLRKPEPYKGKGIRFVGEQVRRKAGKTAGK